MKKSEINSTFSENTFLCLDVGTTGIKASLVNTEGAVLSTAYRKNNLIIPGQNMAELNGDEVWLQTKEVIYDITSEFTDKITAISICTFGEAFVLTDINDNVLCNSMLFLDYRGTEEIKDISAEISAEDIFYETGMTLNPMFSLNKLLWIKKNMPDTYTAAAHIMNYEDFIIYKLTGKRKLSYSGASRTMYYNFRQNNWSDRILNAFNIDKDMLSKPCESGTIAGHITPSVAAGLSLNTDVYVVIGGHDQACALLGAGINSDGGCFDGIGTNECIAVNTNPENISSDKLLFMLKNNYAIEPTAVKGQYMTLGYNPGAASLLNWYINTFEQELYSSQKSNAFYKLTESKCPDEISNILVLPHFSGSGTPYCDSSSSGAIAGLSLNTTKGDIIKAIFEGMCFEIELNARTLERAGIKISSYTCTGGLSNSDLLLQIKADISGKNVYRCGSQDAGITGLAILCKKAALMAEGLSADAGSFRSPDPATMSNPPVKTFKPDQEKHKRYIEKLELYKKLYPNINNIFRSIN